MPLIYVQSHRNGQKYNKYNTTNGQTNGKAVGFINNYNSRINDFNVENACMTKKLRKWVLRLAFGVKFQQQVSFFQMDPKPASITMWC